jgi:hypothetical protein
MIVEEVMSAAATSTEMFFSTLDCGKQFLSKVV